MCAYTSSLVCLSANSMCNRQHVLEFDKQLVNIALNFVDELSQKTGHKGLQGMKKTCMEFIGNAGIVAGHADEVTPMASWMLNSPSSLVEPHSEHR
jgi:hypothetical protein